MNTSHLPPPFAHNYAILLDVDGTLANFRHDPGEVWLSYSLLITLCALRDSLDGALALISGRTVDDLNRIVGERPLCCVGLHGLSYNEHCPPPPFSTQDADGIGELRRECEDFVREFPGVMLEDKQLGIALHYRTNPHCEAAVHDFAREYQRRNAQRPPYDVLFGKMVVEFRPPGSSKGVAVTHLLAHSPFRGRVPVFIGDDVTDEAGFAVVNSVNGVSIKCGVGDTRARFRLPDVSAVHAWLNHYLIFLREA